MNLFLKTRFFILLLQLTKLKYIKPNASNRIDKGNSMEQLIPSTIQIIKKVLRENLNVQKGEKFLICTDFPSSEDIIEKDKETIEKMLKRVIQAKNIYSIAKEEYPDTEIELYIFPCLWKHYVDLPSEMISKIVNCDILYALTEYSLTSEVIKLGKENPKLRAALSPASDESMFDKNGILDIDESNFEKEILTVHNKFSKGKNCRMYSSFGTDLEIEFDKSKFTYETGYIDKPGIIQNLPAGEVTFRNATINGVFVTPKGWLEELKDTLILTIKDSHIVDIKFSSEEEHPETAGN